MRFMGKAGGASFALAVAMSATPAVSFLYRKIESRSIHEKRSSSELRKVGCSASRGAWSPGRDPAWIPCSGGFLSARLWQDARRTS